MAKTSAPRARPTRRTPSTSRIPRTPRSRVIIENVAPDVDEGRFPAKRTVGEEVVVEADVFADGHDVVAAMLLWRRSGAREWTETAMAPLGNDRWRAAFTCEQFADYEFTVEGWVDRSETLRQGIVKKE